jgi:peptide-methionine (S)-S-oxide reductase
MILTQPQASFRSPESSADALATATAATAATATSRPQHQQQPPQQRLRRRRTAQAGHVVTLALEMRPEAGFVPEPLFDTGGAGSDAISFVLHGGNYLPGLHQLVEGCAVGDCVRGASVDAGWGARRADLVVAVPLARLPADLGPFKAGQSLQLPQTGGGTVHVAVTHVNESTVVLDANPPLAGASYTCSFTLLKIASLPSDAACLFDAPHPHPRETEAAPYDDKDSNDDKEDSEDDDENDLASPYRVASFALDCFWGAELALQRIAGVVGTKVGYTRGETRHPTYDQVCTGKTRHREAVLVVYDPSLLSYTTLLDAALERLAQIMTAFSSSHLSHDMFDEEPSSGDESMISTTAAAAAAGDQQYKYGIYYHSPEQRVTALAKRQAADPPTHHRHHPYRNSRNQIEVKEATIFYPAEDEHQQYLYKGGQSTRKGAKERIRCFG